MSNDDNDLDDLIEKIQRNGEPPPPATPARAVANKTLSTAELISKITTTYTKDARLPSDAPAIFEAFQGAGFGMPPSSMCLHYRCITENFHVGTVTNKHLGGWIVKFIKDNGVIKTRTSAALRINAAVDIAREHGIGLDKKVLFAFEWWDGANVQLDILMDGFVRG